MLTRALQILALVTVAGSCSSSPERSSNAGGSGGHADDTGGSGGSGGDGGSGGSGGKPASTGLPATDSADDIDDFLSFGSYRKAPWVSETASPREPAAINTSPHQRVQVWMNPQLVDSLRAGHDGLKDSATGMTHPPLDKGSMAIKELWDESGTQLTRVGSAAIWKVADGDAAKGWAYFCRGPAARCASKDGTNPVYGHGTSVSCGFCHGGLIFTKAP
jgi:hypothetical protein